MKQRLVNLNEFQYLIEYYKNGEDFKDDISKEFIILRNYELYNNVAYDNDIYFIEKSLYDSFKNDINIHEQTEKICFPLHINNIINFSSNFTHYNKYNLSKIDELKYNILSDKNTSKIKCDKIRIYNPTISKDLNFIIHIDNIINDINFHYFCNKNKNFDKKYDKEIVINNVRYVEYIEIYIPNLDYLFDKENKLYILDDINNIININNSNISNITEYYNNLESIQTLPDNKLYFYQIVHSYFLKNQNDSYAKVFIDNSIFNYNTNVLNTMLNITLWPFKTVSNELYIVNDIINPTETFFESNYYFRLCSKFGFDNGVISIINKFIFPGKIDEDPDEYNKDLHGDVYDENYVNKFTYQVTNYYNSFFINENIDEYYDKDGYLDEIDYEEIRTTGYVIQIATDPQFNDIIYESKINTDNPNNNFIYDFSFSLNNIVDDWYQLNELLVARCIFIDKRLNIIIKGNHVVINKEFFKYFINNSSTYQVLFSDINNGVKQNNLIEQNFMDVSYGFNLINNINCTVVDKVIENNNDKYNIPQQTNTQIIYKPIFYKVNDLQNIRIRQGVIQNIGVNLGSYMTRVDTFILNINGTNFSEYARDDVYVIFTINSNDITENSGIYNVLDQNFEYISSGNYIKY